VGIKMEFITCSKNLTTNIASLSNDYSYVINKKNKIIYYSTQKGVSLEYVADLNFNSDDKGVFIYEEFGGVDVVNIVFVNSIEKSIEFKINKSDGKFHLKKVENFIKAICVQKNIKNVYYFENSQIAGNIHLPSFIEINYISRANFRKVAKSNGKLKSNQNKIIFLILFCLGTIVLEFGANKTIEILADKSKETFSLNFKQLESKKNNILIDLEKYENLSQNLKDIKIAKSTSNYLELKKQELEKLKKEEVLQ
jgi:hypothetical protein